MSKLTETVKFDLIRYANCWEDAELLLHGLRPMAGDRIMSIASAGDNCFSLLTTAPAMVCAADLSHPQLFLTELKRAAFARFEYQDLRSFLGFSASTNRWKLYQSLKSSLQPSTQAYWNAHKQVIEEGVIEHGKLENYFRLFARRVLPLIHSSRKIDELLRPKSPEAQEAFYDNSWNSWRWRMLFRLFFSKTVMGRKGRDPEFLRQVDGPVHKMIFQQAERHLKDPAVSNNPFLRRILTGSYGDLLPHYMQEDQFEAIVKNLDALEIRHGYVHEVAAEKGQIDAFNLSDIFEYMDQQTFQKVTESLLSSAAPGATFAYWNLMAPRQIGQIAENFVKPIAATFHRPDHGFFYRAFHAEQLRSVSSAEDVLPTTNQSIRP